MSVHCMTPAPDDASTIGLLCSLPRDHDSHHMATTSRRILAAWTHTGVVTLHYDHATGTSTRQFAGVSHQ